MASSKKASGPTSRLPQILDEAAKLFADNGYKGTSIRDIMSALNMPSGSLYYHFSSKEDLLVAVYQEGVRRVIESVSNAFADSDDPWEQLELACIAHLRAILENNHYAQVITKIMPADVPGEADRLAELRDEYEKIFVKLIRGLPLPAGVSRRNLRLLLLGALNWSRIWYRPGKDSPASIAKSFLQTLRRGLNPLDNEEPEPKARSRRHSAA